MLIKHLSLSLAALLAVSFITDSADAGHRRKFRRAYPGDHYYAGPSVVQGIPGMRLLFGDYALTQEEFDALYGDRPEFDERYYEPEPAAPTKPRKKALNKTAAKPEPAPSGTVEETPEKKVTSMPKSADPAAKTKTAAVDCGKAESIIAGYGFSSAKPESCAGKIYAFNATRDGRNFAIKLDPKSGELTEVKKLN